MLRVDGPEQRRQPEQPGIDQTRRRDGQRNAAKQRQVPLRQPRADILPNACAQKGQPPSRNVNAPHASADASPSCSGV